MASTVRLPRHIRRPGRRGRLGDGRSRGQTNPRHLKQLSMLEWDDSTKRYRLHDLMRAFARGKLSEQEGEAAALRHARYYLELIRFAHNLYMHGGESMIRGLALFDLEWGNIQAGQSWAASHVESDREAATLCNEYPAYGSAHF